MKKAIITGVILFTFFSFAPEKKASIELTKPEYETVQKFLYDIAMSADSLEGSHQTVKRLQNEVMAIQNFLNERVGKQFDTAATKK